MKTTPLKISALLVVIFCANTFVLAQETRAIRAQLVDSKTGSPIPFATVRILKNNSLLGGVVSNTDGDFQIPIRYHTFQNSIVVTCIGYSNLSMKMSELLADKINVIKLREASTQLKEVTVRSKREKKLNAFKIVKLAIDSIPKNYPSKPYSYLAYYRDYQKEENEYVNLNEALIRVFDDGFDTNDFESTKIKLYQYHANTDFKTDSSAALAYDNNNFGGNKFIPTVTVTSFGGNELSLLRIHDPVRNNQVMSFSFVNRLRDDFLRNHRFRLLENVYLDNTPLYHISFESIFFIAGRDHFAKGEIFIEADNFAIHKFVYSTYLREARQERLLYKVQIEYARAGSLMHLNYISFNNFFKSKYDDGFKATDVTYNPTINAFVVTFNRVPQAKSAMTRNNYDFTFDKWPMIIDHVELSPDNPKQVYIFIQNAKDFNFKVKPSDLAKMEKKMDAKFMHIKDIDGNVINEVKYKQVSQFRELFMQRLDSVSRKPFAGFIVSNVPLRSNQVYTKELKDASNYWMNTPLKNNADWVIHHGKNPEQGDSTTKERKDQEAVLAVQPREKITPHHRDISILEEKVYVQTDKPYYYPGERIWLKAYMNYRAPFWRDSLSKVLYAELINPEGKISQSLTLWIDNGVAYGDIRLPASTVPGNYFLRAYTNWMRNFGDKDFFVKPVRIFDLYEQPKGNYADTVQGEVSPGLRVQTQKLKYKPREEVKLEITLSDQDKNPLGANLSVSVTDMTRVMPVRWEKNIVKNYSLDSVRSLVKADSTLHPIEFGISMKGEYFNKKAKSLKTKLMVIEMKGKKLEDFLSSQSDDKGRFWITGLQFSDSASVGIKVDNPSVRGAKFEIYPREIPSTSNITSDSILEVKSNDKVMSVYTGNDLEKDVTLLKEVVVEGVRIRERPVDPMYGAADFSIPSEDIARTNDLAMTIITRIPGLATMSTSSFNSQPPLVIIDGVRVNLNEEHDSDPTAKFGFNEFMAALSRINVYQIERIDFFKYGNSAFYGTAGGNGVLIIHTKKASYDNTKKALGTIDQKSFQTFKVEGYSPTGTFTSPDYSQKESSTQLDYRSTILWQPEVKLEDDAGRATLHFYTADLPGMYRIVVEGVTSDFIPVRCVKFIEVSEPD